MLFDMFIKYNKRLFYPHHRAKQITIHMDGTFTTLVEKYTCDIVKESEKSLKVIPKTELIEFTSRHVVLACGGRQKLKKSTLKKYEISPKTEVFTSDEVLRERKFRQLLSVI